MRSVNRPRALDLRANVGQWQTIVFQQQQRDAVRQLHRFSFGQFYAQHLVRNGRAILAFGRERARRRDCEQRPARHFEPPLAG